ncbi:MAG: ArsR family transcriptional regulator [Psychroflexus sp.]
MKQKNDSVPTSNHNLIEELSSHFVNERDLPPLAAKIYSSIILSKAESLTFEEIIEITGASKSSVSNQLNFLIEENRLDFIYKDDKRKRYFKTKRDYLCNTLESHLEKIQKEIKMLSKVIKYKDDQDFNKKLVAIFKNHLESEKENILDTINNLKQTSHNLDQHEK